MNNINDGTGKKESRVKIIRNDSIGNFSWDSSAESINEGLGVNEWSQADLMIELNSGPYWNRTSGTCYNNSNNATTSCNFTNVGLTSTAKNMIGNAVWNLGANEADDNRTKNLSATTFYNLERGNLTGKQCSSGTKCSDTLTRNLTWTGKVGLMYSSDYGYATAGGSTSNRNTCVTSYSVELMDSNSVDWSKYTDCYKNDWLYNSDSTPKWTITPRAFTDGSRTTFCLASEGYSYSNRCSESNIVNPVVYLKSNVSIKSGDGTRSNPYILEDNDNKTSEYTITYDLDGGVNGNNTISYNSSTATFTLKNPIKTGYTFTGWTGSNGSVASTNVSIPHGSTGNKIFKANWNPNTYKITVVAGSNTTVSGGGNCTYGQTVNFSGSANTNYTWNGWSDGNNAYSRSTTCDGNKTFTTNAATYNPPTYTTTRTGSNGWVGTYTCKNGTGTITSCSHNGNSCRDTSGCTGRAYNNYYGCNYAGGPDDYGGGLSSSISC